MDETKMTEFVEQGRRRRRRAARRGDGRDRRQARAVPGDGRRRAAQPGGAGRPHRHRRAVRARVVERPGGPRLPVLRRRRPVLRCPTSTPIPLTDETSPACVIGAFEIAVGSVYATDTIAERFRTGDGFAVGRPRRARPRRLRTVLPARLPQPPRQRLDPRARRRRSQARAPARGSPTSAAGTARRRCCSPRPTRPRRVVGFDAHDGSIDAARKRAADAGLADRVRFEVASATTFDGTYDLVCFFDCLHDMGDPAGACAHVRDHLAPGGTLMLIEPFANDDLGRQPQPGRRRLLRVLDAAVHAELAVPGRRHRARRPGRRGPAARHRHRRRVHDPAPSRRNAVQHRAGSQGVMKFAQIIEFTTSRIDDFNPYLDAWMARTEGDRIPHRAVLTDRDADDRYCSPWSSHSTAWRTPTAPRRRSLPRFLAGISEGPPTFRNLDVLRQGRLLGRVGRRLSMMLVVKPTGPPIRQEQSRRPRRSRECLRTGRCCPHARGRRGPRRQTTMQTEPRGRGKTSPGCGPPEPAKQPRRTRRWPARTRLAWVVPSVHWCCHPPRRRGLRPTSPPAVEQRHP